MSAFPRFHSVPLTPFFSLRLHIVCVCVCQYFNFFSTFRFSFYLHWFFFHVYLFRCHLCFKVYFLLLVSTDLNDEIVCLRAYFHENNVGFPSFMRSRTHTMNKSIFRELLLMHSPSILFILFLSLPLEKKQTYCIVLVDVESLL